VFSVVKHAYKQQGKSKKAKVKANETAGFTLLIYLKTFSQLLKSTNL
jgi:hypothetical protein